MNNLVICDNKYNILAISDCIDGDHLGGIPHDNFEIIENVKKMLQSLDEQFINYEMSHLSADFGFDVLAFIDFIEKHEIIANIR